MRHSNGHDATPLKETPLRPHRPLWGLVGRVFGEPADPVNRQDASVQCVVARAPLVDLTRFASGNGSGIVASFIGMPYRGEAGGGYATEQRAYHEASPLSHVSPSSSPCLLIHGDADVLVPYEQSTLIQAARSGAVWRQGVCVQALPQTGIPNPAGASPRLGR